MWAYELAPFYGQIKRRLFFFSFYLFFHSPPLHAPRHLLLHLFLFFACMQHGTHLTWYRLYKVYVPQRSSRDEYLEYARNRLQSTRYIYVYMIRPAPSEGCWHRARVFAPDSLHSNIAPLKRCRSDASCMGDHRMGTHGATNPRSLAKSCQQFTTFP